MTALIPFCEGRIGNPSYGETSATLGWTRPRIGLAQKLIKASLPFIPISYPLPNEVLTCQVHKLDPQELQRLVQECWGVAIERDEAQQILDIGGCQTTEFAHWGLGEVVRGADHGG